MTFEEWNAACTDANALDSYAEKNNKQTKVNKNTMNKNQLIDLIVEEISSNLKEDLISELSEEVESCIDTVMLEHGVESQGLSAQQAAFVYRKLCTKIESVIDDYTTKTGSVDDELKTRRKEMM